MSNQLIRPEIVNIFQELDEPVSIDTSFKHEDVVPLFPRSFLDDSKEFNGSVSRIYTDLHSRELNRRNSFLDECVYIDYPVEIERVDVDAVAEVESERAWNRKYTFADGSYLKGSDLRVVDENVDDTDIDKEDSSISDREIILNDHRIKYQLEADRFREELEKLAELDSTFTPIDTTIVEVLDNNINPVVLGELDELFRQSDEREAILAVERERIAKEEKMAQLAAIFKYLHEGLIED